MTTLLSMKPQEFGSGEVVEPGTYMDVESGAIIQVREPDELPEGQRLVHYRRRFRRINTASETRGATRVSA